MITMLTLNTLLHPLDPLGNSHTYKEDLVILVSSTMVMSDMYGGDGERRDTGVDVQV